MINRKRWGCDTKGGGWEVRGSGLAIKGCRGGAVLIMRVPFCESAGRKVSHEVNKFEEPWECFRGKSRDF